jgi:hypothetical protein
MQPESTARMPGVSAEKTQPWKAHWPPSAPTKNGLMGTYQAGEVLAVDGSGSGGYGYNDKGEGIASPTMIKDGEKV